MHKRDIDLNLLHVFQALMRRRNVTRAAADLGLTQPAVSHAIERLRRSYRDPLFVRGGAGVEPTRRALQIAGPIADALGRIAATLGPGDFVPAELDRTFRIGLVGYSGAHFVPTLMEKVASEAPRVRVLPDIAAPGETERRLSGGEIDVAVGVLAGLGESCERAPLLSDRFTVIARQDHPRIGQRLTLASYLACRHVRVSHYPTVDRALAQLGKARDFAVSTENILSVPFMVGRSDLIATITRAIAVVYRGFCGLEMYDLPFDAGSYVIDMAWHVRDRADPGHAWFRSKLLEAAATTRERLLLSAGGEAPGRARNSRPGSSRRGKASRR